MSTYQLGSYRIPFIQNKRLQSYVFLTRGNHSKIPDSSQETYDIQHILDMISSWGEHSRFGIGQFTAKDNSLDHHCIHVATAIRYRQAAI
jgi:hypothetical protein